MVGGCLVPGGGAWSQGVSGPGGGAWSRESTGPGGVCLVLGEGGLVSQHALR